jgi:hypothetical protein
MQSQNVYGLCFRDHVLNNLNLCVRQDIMGMKLHHALDKVAMHLGRLRENLDLLIDDLFLEAFLRC